MLNFPTLSSVTIIDFYLIGMKNAFFKYVDRLISSSYDSFASLLLVPFSEEDAKKLLDLCIKKKLDVNLPMARRMKYFPTIFGSLLIANMDKFTVDKDAKEFLA